MSGLPHDCRSDGRARCAQDVVRHFLVRMVLGEGTSELFVPFLLLRSLLGLAVPSHGELQSSRALARTNNGPSLLFLGCRIKVIKCRHNNKGEEKGTRTERERETVLMPDSTLYKVTKGHLLSPCTQAASRYDNTSCRQRDRRGWLAINDKCSGGGTAVEVQLQRYYAAVFYGG